MVFRLGTGAGGEELLDLVARGLDRSAPEPTRRYSDIWELDILIAHIRSNLTDNETLRDGELQTKAMLTLMIYTACRLAEISRAEQSETQEEEDCFALTTVTKQKQAVTQALRVYRVQDRAVCPVRTLQAWAERREHLNPPRHFFFNLTTRAHMRQAEVSAAFQRVMRQAGIPARFTGYSVKHAVITKLYRLGTPEEQITHFGRWKPGSTVPRTFYYVGATRPQWPGSGISAPAPWLQPAEPEPEKGASPHGSEPRSSDAALPRRARD
jgi:integrase